MGGRARTHADGFGDRRATATPRPCDVLKKRNAALTRSGWAALSRLGSASAAPPAPVLAVGQVNGSPGEGHDHMATGPEPLQFRRGLPERHGPLSLVAICLRTTVRAERHRVQRFSGQVLFPVPDAPAGREYGGLQRRGGDGLASRQDHHECNDEYCDNSENRDSNAVGDDPSRV